MSKYITDYPSPNYKKLYHKRNIKYLIIDSICGEFEDVITNFCNKESHMAVHYVIDKEGKIYHLTDDNNIVSYLGSSGKWKRDVNLDNSSINICLINNEKNLTLIEYDALINLCKDLQSKHQIEARDILARSDVDYNYSLDIHIDWSDLAKSGIGLYNLVIEQIFKKAGKEQFDVICKFNDQSIAVRHVQQKLQDIGYNISVDGRFGKETLAVIRSFSDHYLKYESENKKRDDDLKLKDKMSNWNNLLDEIATSLL